MSVHAKLPRDHRLAHLVLTVKNSPDISVGLSQLLAAFRKMRQTKIWKRHVSGGCFVIEVTGRDGDWHVHIHAIIANVYFPQKQISSLFHRCGGGSYVWIERLKDRDIARYVTKYLSKSEAPPEDEKAASLALKGCRLFQPFGCWYAASQGYKRPPCQCSECHGTEWIPLDIFFARDWNIMPHAPPGIICYEDSGDRSGDELISVPDFRFTLDRSADLFF